MLDIIDIQGCTISIDAMGCQKELAAKIISKKAHFILAIKDNQPTLRLAALLMAKHAHPDDEYMDVDAGHGRVEKRRTRIYRDTASITQFWPGASAVIRVDSLRYDKTNNEYKTQETRFYITSLHHVEASLFARWIRAHWGIENSSRLLRFARNILKRYKDLHPTKLSYRSMKFKAEIQQDFALEMLKAVFV